MHSTTGPAAEAKGLWPKLRLGIFGRIYLFDLLLATLAIAACAAFTQNIIESKLKEQVHAIAHWMVYESFAVPDRLHRESMLLRIYEHAQVRITLYDANGELMGFGGPRFPLPSEEQLALLRQSREEGFTGEEARLSVAVYDGSKFLGYGFIAPASTFSIGFGFLPAILILGVIALIAWPLAVSLLKPLRAMNQTMTRFGSGDLSARVALPGNDEIGELSRGFNHLADHIQELLQAEKILLATVSHELRTPLQRIRLALELATDAGNGVRSAEATQGDARHLASVSADLNDLDELLSDILLVARLDSARTALDGMLAKLPVPADELIAECVERFEAVHTERSIHWLEGPPLPSCDMDPRFVRRALLNLLENAARYSPHHSPVEIASWSSTSHLMVEVRDQGPGIPDELQDRIFEPFFQGDPARGESSGSGLGLSIVKRIAEAHRGKVEVTSSSSGSTFRVTLPLNT